MKSTLFNQLDTQLRSYLATKDWQLHYEYDHGPVIWFAYPKIMQSSLYPSFTYLRPAVKIEIGARSAHEPATEKRIIPYCCEEFPHLFEHYPIAVQVLSETRTFWEKVTLVHAEYHRPEGKKTPERLSRHYYDLFKMLSSSYSMTHCHKELLSDVIRHKQEFYRCGWAKYEEARPGSLRIIPHKRLEQHLINDYREMREMIFGRVPEFEEILRSLQVIESKINLS